MQLRRLTTLMLAVIAAALLHAGAGLAAPPKVPSLPAQTAPYVQYSITNRPPQYLNGPSAKDNTPADNITTDAGATLGRALFYDKRLSHDSSTACASCHKQSKGFSDENQFSAPQPYNSPSRIDAPMPT